MKRFLLTLSAIALLSTSATAQYAPQYGAAVAISGDQLLVGEGRNLLQPGEVFVYEKNPDGMWELSATVQPESAGGEALGFGRALAANMHTLVVGAPLAGEAHVYTRDDAGAWMHATSLSSATERYGAAVALDGDHLLVGATGAGDAPGTVYAYQRSEEGAWNAAGELAHAEVAARDGYGSVLAISGDHAVVGAPQASSRAGAAHSFHFDAQAGAWMAAGTMDAGAPADGDRFGAAALFVGDKLAISSPGDRGGMVTLFARDDAGAWALGSSLGPFDTKGDEDFGASLAYADGRLWVGAPGYDQRKGTVYLFESEPGGDRMTAVSQVDSPNPQFRSTYGRAIAASGGLAAVGAVGQDNFEGAVFPLQPEDGSWMAASPLYNDAGEMASVLGGQIDCREGEAGAFPCNEVDMISFLTRREIGARRGIQVNDVWGWEDPETGREYALVGRTDGTSFIDLTDAAMPRYLGDLPKTATATQSLWRDIKVYKDHAFIVADGAGAHHVQIFDLRQLRDVDDAPVEFEETALYKGVYSSHNIIINENTGFAYAVGNDSGGETCGGALHMFNIQDPTQPTFAGCFADTRTGRRGSGSTHDAQCVTYAGPDTQYGGREICLSSNGNALSIADVTDKENPVAISVAEYPNVAYTHQGWLTEDHRYFYLNDEGDEASGLVDATRTLIFDLSDLEDPALVNEYMGPSSAIDHNLYIRGNTMYQTNYVEGLRLVDITDPENPTEIGYFDTVPYGKNDNSPVLGAWSNYPFFKSGVIVVTSGREGVFFLKQRTVDI